MRTSQIVTALVFGALAFAIPASASAQEALPTKRSEHPLTLPQGYIAPEGIFTIVKVDGVDDTGFRFDGSVDYGITDDFQVGALVAPLVLSPDTEYENPVLRARYRFLKSAIEMGGEIQLEIPVEDNSKFALGFGLPFLLGLNQMTALYVTPTFYVTFADPDAVAELRMPIDFYVNFTESFFMAIRTGVNHNFTSERTVIPLAFRLGFTVPAPHIDIFAEFGLPQFVDPDRTDNEISADILAFGIGARAYFR